MKDPVISAVRYSLAHTPGLVQHGYKPNLDLSHNRLKPDDLSGNLRSYRDAVSYAPNQVFIGNMSPDSLRSTNRPWFNNAIPNATESGSMANMMCEEDFYGFLKLCDSSDLVWLESNFEQKLLSKNQRVGPFSDDAESIIDSGHSVDQIVERIEKYQALPLHLKDQTLVGCINPGSQEDEALSASIILENLASKAAASIALNDLIAHEGLDPESIDYVFSTGEEAVGDPYQRGGGNLAKAIGEQCNLSNATGSDIKAFCCAPVHALIIACGLVKSGVFNRIAVVGGCSVPKLGMNYADHLKNGHPIIEDVLPGIAVIVDKNDGVNPTLELHSVGKHYIGAGSSLRAITRTLVSEPLSKSGLAFTEIDKYALELQNPDITEATGTGDVTERNYRYIGALAMQNGDITREEIAQFSSHHGMPGFSPTQGHIASAIPYLGHAKYGLTEGDLKRTMFIAKGSLFLGRMTNMSDGVSFILKRNENT